jgi:hypothetical protein
MINVRELINAGTPTAVEPNVLFRNLIMLINQSKVTARIMNVNTERG